jgi:hypothetical protein
MEFKTGPLSHDNHRLNAIFIFKLFFSNGVCVYLMTHYSNTNCKYDMVFHTHHLHLPSSLLN